MNRGKGTKTTTAWFDARRECQNPALSSIPMNQLLNGTNQFSAPNYRSNPYMTQASFGSAANVTPVAFPSQPQVLQSQTTLGASPSQNHDEEESLRTFSIKRAAGQFFQGMVSPITTLFKSKENFLLGAGLIAGGLAAMKFLGPGFVKALTPVGLGIAAIQGGMGAYKLSTAKQASDKEEAFYSFGAASVGTALSAVPLLKGKETLSLISSTTQTAKVSSGTTESLGKIVGAAEPLMDVANAGLNIASLRQGSA